MYEIITYEIFSMRNITKLRYIIHVPTLCTEDYIGHGVYIAMQELHEILRSFINVLFQALSLPPFISVLSTCFLHAREESLDLSDSVLAMTLYV